MLMSKILIFITKVLYSKDNSKYIYYEILILIVGTVIKKFQNYFCIPEVHSVWLQPNIPFILAIGHCKLHNYFHQRNKCPKEESHMGNILFLCMLTWLVDPTMKYLRVTE